MNLFQALVVNDSPTQLQLLAGLVRRSGFSPLLFTDAECALRSLRPEEPPALILTDLNMPGVDGWRLCRLLRSPEYEAFHQVPIFIVSATFSGVNSDDIAADLGAEAFFSCPVDEGLFREKIRVVLRGERRRVSWKVLVVEDSESQAELLRMSFTAEGYQTTLVGSAREAAEKISGGHYDLAVIDYHLPDGLGDTLLDRFRIEQPACICIMVTIDPGPDLALDWTKRGAAAYLRKPLAAGYLLELCARLRRERTLQYALDFLEARTQEIRDSEEKYHQLFETMTQGVVYQASSGSILSANPAAEKILGLSLDQMMGRTSMDPEWKAIREDGSELAGDDHPSMRALRTGKLSGPSIMGVFNFRTGRHRWLSVTAIPLFETGNLEPSRVYTTFDDVTERKIAEDALRESERRAVAQRTAIAELALDENIVSGDLDRALEHMAQVLSATLDVSRAGIWKFSEDRAELQCLTLHAAGKSVPCRELVVHTGGLSRYLKALLSESRIDADDACADPRTNELAETYLTPLGISSLLDAGIVVEGKLVGIVCLEHIGPPRKWQQDEKAFANTAASLVAQLFIGAQHRRAEAEREKLQAQLNQAQKMDSIGRLAGGVAHDFNNMLAVILGHAELALTRINPAHPLFAPLQEIKKAADRSANLTGQLLAFARKQTITPRVLDLNETMEGMLQMLRRLIGEHIDLVWLPGLNLWPVEMDPSQIDQILANLCVNARDAISGVGQVTIETGRAAFDEAEAAAPSGFQPGEYVLLSVSDNGCGMSEEVQARLFEPFFTTKEYGKGTGLGLATVYGIVRQNGGFLTVSSEVGHGTEFRLYLPRYRGPAEGGPAERPGELPGGNQETILLVEDEPAILDLTEAMLADMGYRVLAASTPGEALRVAEAQPGGIQLLITDVILPEMSGRDLAGKLTGLFPGLKVLYVSGYTADIIAPQGVLEEGVCFLQKPFTRSRLARRVREALEAAGSLHSS